MAARPPPPLTLAEQESVLALHHLLIATFTDASSHSDKVRSLTDNASPEQLRETYYRAIKNEHPDLFLRRFLVFTSNDAHKAHSMVVKHLHWRRSLRHIDDELLADGEPGAVRVEQDPGAASDRQKQAALFMQQFRSGKAFTHGVDKDRQPVTIVRVKLHKISAQPPEIMERFIIWQIENTRLFYEPGVESGVMLFDLDGFGMANMDYKMIQFIIDTYTRYYPLGLGAVVIFKSPWIFTACWKLIKGWVPADFQDRIHFAKNAEELSALIPKSNIIQSMGGDDAWEYRYTDPEPLPEEPSAEDQTKKQSLLKDRLALADRLDANTKEWAEAAAAKGDVTEARTKREAITAELKSNYWALDPLIRARGLYDAWGYIKSGA